ncbi:MAG: hypothetical protein OSB09_05670 [Planctomycetota bacterium]|nr:hypothetical protein [Planctomycetota bacterium]
MLASIGLALTPTLLCAMFGMVILLILDGEPRLARHRSVMGLFLTAIIGSFALLCSILLYLKIPMLVTLIMGGTALLFLLPATFRIAARDGQKHLDASPLLWRWRSAPGSGPPDQMRTRLDAVQRQLVLKPMDPILHLKAMELALAARDDSLALYHAHLLDEILSSGEAHAHVLWTIARVIAVQQQRPEDALCVLRRFEQLYPAQREKMREPRWPTESPSPRQED